MLRFDDRELFFPTAVDEYVGESSLWVGDSQILKPGQVELADLDDHWGSDVHLRFISDEERRNVVKEEARRLARKLFTLRLGRVGLFGRTLDALFILTNLVRPITPGRTAIAAALKAERLGLHRKPTVYGRVVQAGEWLILHYSYFYAMNDWRTGYRGLNDHEADWEQAWIFLDPTTLEPEWVASSSHDHRGADLRRHWTDPELITIEGRPVLYPGAGSHALYFRPGDYVTRLDVPALRWLLRAQAWARRSLRIRDEATAGGLGPALGAPFVDSATGDGRDVREWDVRPLDDAMPWVGTFRGLWGLDTGDPAGGERGPSGPKFNRNGEVRIAWADPIGFAGLHGTPPEAASEGRVSTDKLDRVLADLDEQIRRRGRLLPLAQLTGNPGEMDEESDRLTELLRQRSELEDLRRRIDAGVEVSADRRSHLEAPATPLPPPRDSGFLLAAWAAASIPLILLSIAAVIVFENVGFFGIALFGGMVATIGEQLARRHFAAALRISVLAAAVILFFLFVVGGALVVSRYAIGALLAAGGIALFAVNLSELRAVQHFRSRTAEEQQRLHPASQSKAE